MNRFDSKNTGILRASDMKTLKGKLVYAFIIVILTITAIISMLPTAWTILSAFKDSSEIYSSFSIFPRNVSFAEALKRISESWKLLDLTKGFANTVILSIGDLVCKVIVCGFGGYVLSKLKPRGSKLVFTLVVWTMMMPGQIRMVPNYISYLHFPFAADINMGVNLLDTFWPMWLGAGADTFAVLLFKNAFDALSQSYVEAAKLDGCGDYGVFFRIMLPLSLPTVIYVSIITLSSAWSEFFTPLLVLDKNVIIPLQLYRLKSNLFIKQNTYFMALVFASIPQFVIFVLFQKHIMGGVNIGGVKG